MTDAPSPAPAPAAATAPAAPPPPRFHAGWAFAAAATAFAVLHAAVALASPSRWVHVALVLAAVAIPGWVGVGAMIAGHPDGEGRAAARSRALTALTAVAMGLVLAGAIFALLYAVYPVAAYAFGAACLVMVFWADRAS
jgi:hypothetical protein